MARVTGPLSSFSVRGQLKNGPVFQVRNGVRLARHQNPPSQPRTAAQVAQRDILAWLNIAWLRLPQPFKQGATAYSRPGNLPQRQLWLGANLAALKGETTLRKLVWFTGGPSRFAPDNPAFSSFAAHVTFTCTAPTIPSGWTIHSLNLFAMEDQNPQGAFSLVSNQSAVVPPPYSVTIPVFGGGLTWYAAAYFRFTQPGYPTGQYFAASASTALVVP